MALYIKNPRAEELAGLLAGMFGSNKTQVVIDALEEKFAKTKSTAGDNDGKAMRFSALKHLVDTAPPVNSANNKTSKQIADALWEP